MNEKRCAVTGCNDPVTHSQGVAGENLRMEGVGSLGPMTFEFEANFCSRHSLRDYTQGTFDPTL